MSQFFYIHSENPQVRLINQAVEILRNGGVIVYPTDSGYALGCMIGDKHAMDRGGGLSGRRPRSLGIATAFVGAVFQALRASERAAVLRGPNKGTARTYRQ